MCTVIMASWRRRSGASYDTTQLDAGDAKPDTRADDLRRYLQRDQGPRAATGCDVRAAMIAAAASVSDASALASGGGGGGERRRQRPARRWRRRSGGGRHEARKSNEGQTGGQKATGRAQDRTIPTRRAEKQGRMPLEQQLLVRAAHGLIRSHRASALAVARDSIDAHFVLLVGAGRRG